MSHLKAWETFLRQRYSCSIWVGLLTNFSGFGDRGLLLYRPLVPYDTVVSAIHIYIYMPFRNNPAWIGRILGCLSIVVCSAHIPKCALAHAIGKHLTFPKTSIRCIGALSLACKCRLDTRSTSSGRTWVVVHSSRAGERRYDHESLRRPASRSERGVPCNIYVQYEAG